MHLFALGGINQLKTKRSTLNIDIFSTKLSILDEEKNIHNWSVHLKLCQHCDLRL